MNFMSICCYELDNGDRLNVFFYPRSTTLSKLERGKNNIVVRCTDVRDLIKVMDYIKENNLKKIY